LLPSSPKSFSGLEFAGKSRQVFLIGGDSFDFMPLPDDHAAFIICDVSGKGITAALIWAALRAALRREIGRASSNLAGLLTQLHHLTIESTPESRFITLFYAQYDPRHSRLQYANAGHPPPLLIRNQARQQPLVRLLDTEGPPVGLRLPNPSVFQQGEVILQPGDTIVAYTDGVIEAFDPDDPNDRGIQELHKAAVPLCESLSPMQIVNQLFAAIDARITGGNAADDMTLLIVRTVESRDVKK
jgi:phosphoserine phosphatase RsbU/P